MSDRDKYGNYVNDKGVTIKINTDKNGNDHISFYGGKVDKPHDAAHVNINYDTNSWSSTTHGPDKSDTIRVWWLLFDLSLYETFSKEL